MKKIIKRFFDYLESRRIEKYVKEHRKYIEKIRNSDWGKIGKEYREMRINIAKDNCGLHKVIELEKKLRENYKTK